MENNCPLQSTEKRLNDCLLLWENAKSTYFEPDAFILNLNNLIQALRTVTFILQKNKNFLTSFDNWYEKWQFAMKKDEILTWLKEARNYIEKEGDLKTLSKVRLSIVNTYFEPPIFEKEISPFTKNEEFIKIITGIKPKKINIENGFLRAERRWIDSNLESRELIEATAYVYIFLLNLIIDAHHKLIDSETKNNCEWYHKNIRLLPITLTMINQNWYRTIWMDLETKETITPGLERIKNDDKTRAKAKKRYGKNLDNFISELRNTKNFKSEAEVVFKQAKFLLLKDGYHLPIIILGYPNGPSIPILCDIEDRKEKYMFFRYLASVVSKTFAISIMIIGEVWISQLRDNAPYHFPSDDPDHQEALSLTSANNKGERYSFTVFFTKDKDGNIILGKEFSSDDVKGETTNLLIPIFKVWNQSL